MVSLFEAGPIGDSNFDPLWSEDHWFKENVSLQMAI